MGRSWVGYRLCEDTSRLRYNSSGACVFLLVASIFDEPAQTLGIAKGLQYMHDRDIIHSDLKPVSRAVAPGP